MRPLVGVTVCVDRDVAALDGVPVLFVVFVPMDVFGTVGVTVRVAVFVVRVAVIVIVVVFRANFLPAAVCDP